MIKTIYSAKPYKDGYKITRYKWSDKLRRYTDVNVLVLLADKEQADFYIKGVEENAKQDGFKTETEKTKFKAMARLWISRRKSKITERKLYFMAINKTKNINLQITISKADAERLESAQQSISALLDIELTKSQTIAFLIKNYGKTPINNQNETLTKAPKINKNGVYYGAQVRALKDKMQASYTELSVMLGISASTLKKYASDKQQPQGENLQLLNDALKRYGIK